MKTFDQLFEELAAKQEQYGQGTRASYEAEIEYLATIRNQRKQKKKRVPNLLCSLARTN